MDADDTAVFKPDVMYDAFVSRPKKGFVLDPDSGKKVFWATMTEAYFLAWFQLGKTRPIYIKGQLFSQRSHQLTWSSRPSSAATRRTKSPPTLCCGFMSRTEATSTPATRAAVARLNAIGFEQQSEQGRSVMRYAQLSSQRRAQLRAAGEKDDSTPVMRVDDAALDDEDAFDFDAANDTMDRDGNTCAATGATSSAPGIGRARRGFMNQLSSFVAAQREVRAEALDTQAREHDASPLALTGPLIIGQSV